MYRLQLTAHIKLHKSAPRKNACPLNGRAFLCDVMSQSELTTVNICEFSQVDG